MKKYKVSIIGSGSLASIIGKTILKEVSGYYEVLGVMGKGKENALRLSKDLNCKAYDSLDEMIDDKPDYIIEAASPDLVKDMGVKVLENGINLIPLSVGALADGYFYKQIEKTAIKNNTRVHIPSGAVGGFDVLQAAMMMGEAQVSITTEKSPESLNGAPFLKGRELSESSIEEVFTSSAKEAIEYFPKNVNVAVATALATIGPDDTRVIIKSIPEVKSNKHHIELVGESVKIDVIIESIPSIDNPKSSTLAAYSVIRLLENLVTPITF